MVGAIPCLCNLQSALQFVSHPCRDPHLWAWAQRDLPGISRWANWKVRDRTQVSCFVVWILVELHSLNTWAGLRGRREAVMKGVPILRGWACSRSFLGLASHPPHSPTQERRPVGSRPYNQIMQERHLWDTGSLELSPKRSFRPVVLIMVRQTSPRSILEEERQRLVEGGYFNAET